MKLPPSPWRGACPHPLERSISFKIITLIGSVCPLGFIKNGRNINYYDDKELSKIVEPFIVNSIKQLLQLPFKKDRCYCIGGKKNFRYLSKLNDQYNWFEKIIPLPHPRFIMQYRRKKSAGIYWPIFDGIRLNKKLIIRKHSIKNWVHFNCRRLNLAEAPVA